MLLKLADQANDYGECWPAQRTIARECGMSRATVQRKLDELKDRGLLEVLLPGDHGRDHSSNVYRLVGVPQSEAGGASRDEAGGASLVRHKNRHLTINESRGANARNPTADHDCPDCATSCFSAGDLETHKRTFHPKAA